MRGSWRTTTVAALGRVITGKTPSTAERDLFGGQYPFITPSDIRDSRYCEPERFLSERGRESQPGLMLPAQSVCVTCIASIGKTCMTRGPSFTNQQINSVVVDQAQHDPFFVHYLLRTKADRLKSIASGAATPIVNKSMFSAMEVEVPALAEQRRIAGILSGYDDLIENCELRARLLEKMIRALYREWFVNFRYPGHEKVPLVASGLGRVPKGWSVRALSEIAEVNRDQVDTRNPPSRIRYIDISSVSPGRVHSVAELAFSEAPGRARRIVRRGDVLWSCVRPNRRSHALVLDPAENTIASTGFAVLSAELVSPVFLYAATTTDDFVAYLEKRATGAAYPAVTAKVFEQAPLVVPDPAVEEAFGSAMTPLAEGISSLRGQIENLRQTRDLLLPRLLSGQVELGGPG